jgi:hypothetical protein
MKKVYKDKIVEKVVNKFIDRSNTGIKKYGSTMYNEIETGKKDFYDFINDVQEELMDAILYIQSVKYIIEKKNKK